VRARIERRAQDVGFRTFGLMRFSTVSFGNTSLAIAAQSAHQAALAELGSSNPVPSRGESGANRNCPAGTSRRSRPRRHPPQGDRGFESISLQRGVMCEPD
jgi:hypothetical protein